MDRQQIGRLQCQFPNNYQFNQLLKHWLSENKFRHLVTLNPEMVVLAQTDADFRQAIKNADFRLPDGAGIIWARDFLRSNFQLLLPSLLFFPFIKVERLTGVSCVFKLAQLCEQKRQLIYLLGGTPFQVKQTANELFKQSPRLRLSTSMDHAFDLQGPAKILADIKKKNPAVILVAYGAPQQALWIQKHKAELSSIKIAVGVGGAFAIISQDKPRAPKILRRLNLEWLWRLILEPKRWPRIVSATIKYPLLVRQQKKMLSLR